MRKNPPNFRRDVKHLWKNYQKGKVSKENVLEWFEERGIICHAHWVPELLKTNIASRIFARLGRAAQKQSKLVQISDIILVWKFKKWYVGEAETMEYHKIPFYIPALQEETFYKMIYIKDI